MSLNYVQALTNFQAGAGVVIGATSITLVSFADIYGNVLTMANFGAKGYGTCEPDSGNEESFTFTGVVANANGTFTLTGVSTVFAVSPYTETSGLVRGHGGGTKVVISDTTAFWNTFANKNNNETINGQWTFSNLPITPSGPSIATTSVLGIMRVSVAPSDSANPIAVGINDPIIGAPTGSMIDFAGRVAPTSWLLADASAVSRSTYANLFAVICPSQSFTATSASPCVVTATAHSLKAGERIHFSGLTGGRGISVATEYYVLTTGLTTNTFEFALSPEGTAVNTTGTESGTLYKSVWGMGDGSTTFNLPDSRSRVFLGLGSGTTTIKFETGAVGTNTIALPSYFSYPYQGQAVQFTTTGTLPTGISTSTTYYVIRNSSTSISLATSQANANAGTAMSITASSGSGVHTIVYTNVSGTVLGSMGGEEIHGSSTTEMPSHTHTTNVTTAVFNSGGSGGVATWPTASAGVTGATGGNTVHNNMSPFGYVNKIIKI